MFALTLIQPWATAIIEFGKDVENRGWTPSPGMIGQRFAIHAGKKLDKEAASYLQIELGHGRTPDAYPQGLVLGTVELAGYVARDGKPHGLTPGQLAHALNSPWRAQGSPCLWLLRDPRKLEQPIPFKGAQLVWKLPGDVAKQLRQVEELAHV